MCHPRPAEAELCAPVSRASGLLRWRPGLGLLLWLLSSGLAHPAAGHPLAPSLLELRETRPGLYAVTWKTPRLQARGARLEPLLPEACRDTTPAQSAREGSAWVTRWSTDCGAAGLAGRELGVRGLVERSGGAVLRVESVAGDRFQALLTAGSPSVPVPETPSVAGVMRDYAVLGIEHLVFGFDHVLFVLGLLLLVRGRRSLLLTITAFTLGHSVTLSLVALGLVAVPTVWIEVAVALTLLLLALEIVPGARGMVLFGARPWRAACLFGLLHGFGFAGALAQIGLPRTELLTALLSFNVGIELGQLALVGAALSAVALFGSRLRAPSTTLPRTAAAYAIGTLAAYWMFERAASALFG